MPPELRVLNGHPTLTNAKDTKVKPRLAPQEHADLGQALARISGDLTVLKLQVHHAYPHGSPQARKLHTAIEALGQARSALDSALAREHPAEFHPHTYYPRAGKCDEGCADDPTDELKHQAAKIRSQIADLHRASLEQVSKEAQRRAVTGAPGACGLLDGHYRVRCVDVFRLSLECKACGEPLPSGNHYWYWIAVREGFDLDELFGLLDNHHRDQHTEAGKRPAGALRKATS